ncbi:hypothetical protein Lesp01_88620 [Lentzea sp. NBRC 102530]|nr:hypothetical protein Lesp01_88620 [Lentzea sp. NBRC 102530]
MLADLTRLSVWLRPLPTPEPDPARLSWAVLSSCCDAPVVQCYEWLPDVFPVTCTGCGLELGAPGREDLDLARGDLPFERPGGLPVRHRGHDRCWFPVPEADRHA